MTTSGSKDWEAVFYLEDPDEAQGTLDRARINFPLYKITKSELQMCIDKPGYHLLVLMEKK